MIQDIQNSILQGLEVVHVNYTVF